MIRETFESAVKFGGVILQELGVDEDEVERITEEIRDLDNLLYLKSALLVLVESTVL
jgi:translation initiation factor 2 alpha subunit (eIF-2alpha)